MMSPAAAARKRHRSGGDGGEGGDVALAVASGGSQAVSRTLGSGAATIVGCDMDGSARAGGVLEQDVVRPNGTTGGLALAVLSDRPAAVVEESAAATMTGSLLQKKQQRLVQKAATRPSEDVMAQAPAGMPNIGAAPKLSEFKELASTSAEQRELHAVAFHEWMQKNISKTGIQQETRVRVMYRLNTRMWRWLRSCEAKTHARLTFYSLYIIMTDGVWHVRACAGQVLEDGRDLRRLGGALGDGGYCRVADELGLPWARAHRCAGRHECDRSADADVRDDHEFFARGALPVWGGWLG